MIRISITAAALNAIGQILAYMGDLMGQNPRVRGIIVASEFTPRAMSAARAAPSVRLVNHGYQFAAGS
jgi:hypothetical protein